MTVAQTLRVREGTDTPEPEAGEPVPINGRSSIRKKKETAVVNKKLAPVSRPILTSTQRNHSVGPANGSAQQTRLVLPKLNEA